jgi:xylulokinase
VTAGVDIGTTSVKAVAVDATGQVVGRVRLPHPLLVPAPDRLEHDADRAWRRGPRRAVRQLPEVAAVAVSAMVPSLTAVDGRGRPIAPGLLYGDARGGEDEGAGFLRWLRAEAPDAAGYWPAPAVANLALGGVGVMDTGTAFALGLADDPKLAAVGGIGSPIGRVTGTTTELVTGCVDGFCEQVVAGADEPGDVLVVCGTTLLIWIVTEAEQPVPGLWTVPHPSGRWVVGGASNAGGLFQDWARRLLGRGRAEIDPADIPVWVPYIRGERTPVHDPNRRAALHGLDLTHGPAALERAIHEAAGHVVRHHIDLAGLPVRRIVATGGGTRDDGLMHALADCTGLPVHVAAEPEGAAIGAAYLARMGLGLVDGFAEATTWARTSHVVDPDPVWADRCADRYRTFRDLAGAP